MKRNASNLIYTPALKNRGNALFKRRKTVFIKVNNPKLRNLSKSSSEIKEMNINHRRRLKSNFKITLGRDGNVVKMEEEDAVSTAYHSSSSAAYQD